MTAVLLKLTKKPVATSITSGQPKEDITAAEAINTLESFREKNHALQAMIVILKELLVVVRL